MQHFTFEEGVRMDALLLAARKLLVEAERVSQGQLVRVRIYADDAEPMTLLLPARVARYAQLRLGAPAPFSSGFLLLFFSQGAAVRHLPTDDGRLGFVRAVAAHLVAEQKRARRRLAQDKRKHWQQLRQQEGGQQQ